MLTIPAPPSASDRGFPSPPVWPGEGPANGRNRRGSDRSSGRARSPLRLSPRLAQLLQTGIPATDDGWRVMIPEMLQLVREGRPEEIQCGSLQASEEVA